MKGTLFSILILILALNITFILEKDINSNSEIRGNNISLNRSILDDIKCIDCHKDIIKEKYKHPPKVYVCNNCHQSNGKEHPQDTIKGFNSPSLPTNLCYSCHNDIKKAMQKSSKIHQAIYEKQSCTNCHSPHTITGRFFLKSNDKELCLSCHNKTYTNGINRIKNIKYELKKSTSHQAIEEGCSVCHNPHSSESNSLLADSFPSKIYTQAKLENFALCFNCHESKLLTTKLTGNETKFRNGNINMHYLHVLGVKARSCNTCHDPHATKSKHLIRENLVFGKWKMKITYRTFDSGGSCLSGCHSEKKYDRTAKFIKEVAPPILVDNDIKSEQDSIAKVLADKAKNDSIIKALAHIAELDSIAKVLVDKAEKDSIAKILAYKEELNSIAKKDSIKRSSELEIKSKKKSNQIILPEKPDTCFINNLPFELITGQSKLLLLASIRNGKIEITNSSGQLLEYRVIRFVFTNRGDDNSPSIRHYGNRITYSTIQILKNAKPGDKFHIEEIEIANASKEILTNSVKPLIIKRIKKE